MKFKLQRDQQIFSVIPAQAGTHVPATPKFAPIVIAYQNVDSLYFGGMDPGFRRGDEKMSANRIHLQALQ
jgi:hypothetical protein